MKLSDLRRQMENAGVDPEDIEEQLDRLAEDLQDHDRDERTLDQLRKDIQ